MHLPVAYIVLELVDGYEIFYYIDRHNEINQSFGGEVTRYYFKQMLDAINYLH